MGVDDKVQSPSQPDSVEKPQDSAELSRLSEALAAPPSDEARLERLRLEVAAGTYEAPASDISRKIVEDSLEDS
jgi:anti-sigma28 factor (negative regulator of flagellin synthesis)